MGAIIIVINATWHFCFEKQLVSTNYYDIPSSNDLVFQKDKITLGITLLPYGEWDVETTETYTGLAASSSLSVLTRILRVVTSRHKNILMYAPHFSNYWRAILRLPATLLSLITYLNKYSFFLLLLSN